MIRFRDVGLIDVVSGEFRPHLDVDVDGGRFTAVGPTSGSGDAPIGTTVIECDGKILAPGLIDCHVHYTIDAEDPMGIAQSQHEPIAPAAMRAAGMARRALEAGITTARSAGAQGGLDIALRDAIASGRIAGPRILAAGAPITTTGGHGYQFSYEADDRSAVLTAVRRTARDGADLIKLMASEAAMLTPETEMLSTDEAGGPQYSTEEMSAIVVEARRLGRRVMAHAQGAEAVKRAARAGVDSVEHAFLADDEALDALAENDTVLVPTLLVTDVWSRIEGISSEERRRQDAIEVRHRRSSESAVRKGIRLATGTDTGVPGVLPEMLWREVQLLHEHGARPIDAIRAATSWAAELLGLSAEVGSIDVGKRADAILLAGDPLVDLGQLARPQAVMQAGILI